MSFTTVARPAVIGSKAAPGIRASLRVNKAGIGTVMLIVPASRFHAFSGDPVGRKFDVRIGRVEHLGHIRIEEAKDGALTFVRGVKGCAVLKLDRWDVLPNESRKADVCTVSMDGNGIVLRLPPWAFPEEPRRLAAGAAA